MSLSLNGFDRADLPELLDFHRRSTTKRLNALVNALVNATGLF